MKKSILILFIFSLLSFYSNISAQDTNYPKTTQNGKEFYLYEVKEDDGLYKISKSFNISQEDILQYNPQAVSGINAGMTLKIPVTDTKKVTTATPAPIAKKTIEPAITTKIDGNFKIHTVEAGQTLYSISKLYNVTIEDILLHNEEVNDGLKVGMELKIPTTKTVISNQEQAKKPTQSPTPSFIEHVVAPKETLYGVSKEYNVSVDELNKYNPDLASGMKIGQILKIPTKKVAKTESTVKSSSPKPAEKVVKPVEKAIQPTPVQKDKTNASPIGKNVKVALLLPFMLNDEGKQDATITKFVEFYEGALLAINKLKQEGVSIQLFTYDIEKTALKAQEVIQTNNVALKKVDLIIGPAYSAQVKEVSEFAQANNIPLVVPFSPKIESISTNPYLFQNNAPQQKQFNEASKVFIKKFKDKNIIILNFNNDLQDEGSEFSKALKVNLKRQKIAYKELAFTQENYATIQNSFVQGKESIIVFATDKANLIKDLLPKITRLNNQTTPISVFGFSSWDKTLKTYPSTYYYTSFFVNKKAKNNGLYREKFRQEFGAPSTSATPRFDLMGYDLSYYFIKAFFTYGKSFATSLSNIEQTETLQTKFHFEKQNQGGYINTGIQLIHYTEDKDLEIVE